VAAASASLSRLSNTESFTIFLPLLALIISCSLPAVLFFGFFHSMSSTAFSTSIAFGGSPSLFYYSILLTQLEWNRTALAMSKTRILLKSIFTGYLMYLIWIGLLLLLLLFWLTPRGYLHFFFLLTARHCRSPYCGSGLQNSFMMYLFCYC